MFYSLMLYYKNQVVFPCEIITTLTQIQIDYSMLLIILFFLDDF